MVRACAHAHAHACVASSDLSAREKNSKREVRIKRIVQTFEPLETIMWALPQSRGTKDGARCCVRVEG